MLTSLGHMLNKGMTDNEIKNKIQQLADQKYRGSYRFFKPKFLKELIGDDGYQRIFEKLSIELHNPYSVAIYCFMNDILERPKCSCGNFQKFNTTKKQFSKYCSDKCRFQHSNETKEIREKTNLEKYGNVNIFASDYGKDKIEKTNLEKYGVSNYTKTENYKNSVIGTKRSKETREKTQLAHRKLFYNSLSTRFPTCDPLFTIDEYKGVKGYIQYKWFCKTCKNKFLSSCDNGCSPVCPTCKPMGTKHELLVRDFLQRRNIPFEYNWRKLPSKREVDVYIPSLKLGFEICGLYWHSSARGCGKLDHLSKHEECEKEGIRLITIFDDEFYQKSKIVFNRIRSNLGLVARKIYARKCDIIELDASFCKKFLNKYHIQGAIGGQYRYGLKYKNHIVAVMTFNKGRLATGHESKDSIFELGRYCTLANFSIVGGAGRLFNHFINVVRPNTIFSYCDK